MGTMLMMSGWWERESFAYYHMIMFAVALVALWPVVAYCSRRRFALKSALETN